MGRKAKYSKEIKIKACKEYLSRKKSLSQIAFDLDPTAKCLSRKIRIWVKQYKTHGPSAFNVKKNNNSYSREFKETVVKEYLSGNESIRDLANKYNIPSAGTLENWIRKYNRGEELTDYHPSREAYSMKSRKVTREEKEEIINYVLSNDNDYKGAAVKYKVPYHQVFNWVKKYKESGEESFEDRRGRPKTKADQELTEVERLQIELEKENETNERLKLEIEILKKNEQIRKELAEGFRK